MVDQTDVAVEIERSKEDKRGKLKDDG